MILSANGEASQDGCVSPPVTEASCGCPKETYRKQPPIVEYPSLLSGHGKEINVAALPSFQRNSIILLALGPLLGELFYFLVLLLLYSFYSVFCFGLQLPSVHIPCS